MVNTGRPSGACGVCRERRIKCDETKPACLKCIRSGRTCSGYSQGLRLRDQTQKTINKARLGKPRAKRLNGSRDRLEKKSPATSTPMTPSSTGSTPKQQAARPRSLSLPTHGDHRSNGSDGEKGHRRSSTGLVTSQDDVWPFEAQVAEGSAFDTLTWQTIHTPLVEQARCYFLSSYVVYSPKSSCDGMFTFIPSLLASNDASKQHFEDLFTAVSIAAFSMRPNASHASTFSRLYYGRGVAELRKALGDKTLVKSDAALASTILLGFYEGIVNEGVGIVSYNPHFEGALALLRVRGDEQFSTMHGAEMFDFVMQVLMRQYELSLDVTEEDLCQWTVQASMHPEHRKPHLTAMWVGDLRLRVARLIEARERSVTTIQTAMEILGAAQKFERLVTRRFEAEDRELLGEEIVPCAVSPEHPAGRKIVYSDWWTATRSINKYAFRLLLCHIIADVSGWLDGSESQFTGSGSKAAQIARQDIDSIIASIPYLCSWRAGASRGASSPCGRDDIASVEGITSLLVIWPLYLAGDSQFATREQKEYIQRRLGWIAENRGVKHASGVSKHLQNAGLKWQPIQCDAAESGDSLW